MRWMWVFAVLAAGCETVEGSGALGSEVRIVEPFEGVRVTANIDARVELGGDEYSAVLVCDDNLIPLIELDVFNNELELGVPTGTAIEPEGDCEAVITAPEVHAFTLFGTGDIVTKGTVRGVEVLSNSGSGKLQVFDIDASHIMIDLTATGDIKASGVAEQVDYFSSGSGDIKAKGLDAEDVWIRTTGSGDFTITATQSLDVTLEGTGGIKVFGDPEEIDERVTGTGDLKYH